MPTSFTRPLLFLALTQIAVFAAVAAVVVLCGSLYLLLEPTLGKAGAAVWFALALACSAAAVGFIAWVVRRDRRPQASGSQGDLQKVGVLLGREFASLSNQHPVALAAGSLLAGLAVGASPPLRRALLDLIVPPR